MTVPLASAASLDRRIAAGVGECREAAAVGGGEARQGGGCGVPTPGVHKRTAVGAGATTISGMGDVLSRATLSDTPPWKVVVAVLKGVKLATGTAWTVGVSVVMWLTSKTSTVAFMPAPLPTTISALPSSVLTNLLFTVLPMSAAATTAPPMNDEGEARKSL